MTKMTDETMPLGKDSTLSILSKHLMPESALPKGILHLACFQKRAGVYTFLDKAGRAELSVSFVFGLAGIAGLFAGIAPIVRFGAGLVMPPRRLVEDGESLKRFTGQGLQINDCICANTLHRIELQIPLEVSGIQP